VRTSASDRWIENRPTAGWRALDLAELWAYRELVAFLALRDLKVRYKQAAFGVAWAGLQPLAGLVVFTLVFHKLARVPSDGIPYPTFAFLGFSVWSYLSATLNSAITSLVGNAPLITKVYFPRLAAPLATLLPGLVDLSIAFGLLTALMLWYRVVPGPALLALPACVAALIAVALGAGLLLTTLNVRYRDIRQVSGLVIQLWFFASPVAYPSSLVHEGWRWLYAVNPMVGIVDAFRWSVLRGPAPGAADLVSLASGALLLLAGVACFQRGERRFADII
jgi:lipopolysaccharide transport system permease protein